MLFQIPKYYSHNVLLLGLCLLILTNTLFSQSVNTFTGDLNYSIPTMIIPGPDGSDYTVMLNYKSNPNVSEESGWVGYGWSLDVGSIMRQVKGYPDDWKKQKITTYNKRPYSLVVTSAQPNVGAEISSQSNEQDNTFLKDLTTSIAQGKLGYRRWYRFSNDNGLWAGEGPYLNLAGITSLNYQRYQSEKNGASASSFSWDINWAAILQKGLSYALTELDTIPATSSYHNELMDNRFWCSFLPSHFSNSLYSSQEISFPSELGQSFNGYVYSKHSSFQAYYDNGENTYGGEYGVNGTCMLREFNNTSESTVCGYLYSKECYSHTNDLEGLKIGMDYYLERNIGYREDDIIYNIPFANKDSYFVSGGGQSGEFQVFQSTAGVFRPNLITSKTQYSDRMNPEAGLGLVSNDRWWMTIGINVGFNALDLLLTAGDLLPTSQRLSPDELKSNSLLKTTGYFNSNKYLLSSEFTDNHFEYGKVRPDVYYGIEYPDFKFKMINDVGTDFKHTTTTDPISNVYKDGNIEVKTPSGLFKEARVINTATNIRFTTFRDMKDEFKRLAVNSKVDQYLSLNEINVIPETNEQILADQIGEFSITGNDGRTSIYGLPVFARNEKNIKVSLPNDNFLCNNTSVTKVNNTQVYFKSDNDLSNAQCIGDSRVVPYVSGYLLTEIHSPDYIDVTHNGATPDDYGTYVKFNYRRVAGTNEKSGYSNTAWNYWRVPYSGFQLERGELSENEDDFGSYSSGERELYYLESIETKTHIAIFITNKTAIETNSTSLNNLKQRTSYIERLDGYEPDRSPSRSSLSPVSNGVFTALNENQYNFSQQSNKAEYLERIELYLIKGNGKIYGKPLTTTRFEYDNSIMQGQYSFLWNGNVNLPNNHISEGLPNAGYIKNCFNQVCSTFTMRKAGRLTLRKMWMESKNVKEQKISPYIFNYQVQPSDLYGSMQYDLSEFPQVQNDFDKLFETNQNPEYNRFAIDAWGKYLDKSIAIDRVNNGLTWLPQNEMPTTFDPSAYNLKSIQTPSGGRIFLQYEQNTYSFVHSNPSCGMVKVKPDPQEGSISFILNLDDLGIEKSNLPQVDAYLSYLHKELKPDLNNPSQRVFFQFLYAIKGDVNNIYLNPDQRATIVKGHAPVYNLERISLPNGGWSIKITIGKNTSNPDDISTPTKLARNLVFATRRGLLKGDFSNSINIDHCRKTTDIYDDMSDVIDKIETVANSAYLWDPSNFCSEIDYDHSYIRLPILNKAGNGVRVKRLLTIDPGIQMNDEKIFGKEYKYIISNESNNYLSEQLSSGVAINEPSSIHNENALVTVLEDILPSEMKNKIIGGRDLLQFQGPMYESLIPQAGIGYSNVYEININKVNKLLPNVNNTLNNTELVPSGFLAHKYYTVKDYPLIVYKKSNLIFDEDKDILNKVGFGLGSDAVLKLLKYLGAIEKLPEIAKYLKIQSSVTNDSKYNYITQNFSAQYNNRHGLNKSATTYSGNFYEPSTWYPILNTVFEYNEPYTLDIKTISDVDKPINERGELPDYMPGRENELFMYSTYTEDENNFIVPELDGNFVIEPSYFDKATIHVKIISSLKALLGFSSNNITRYPSFLKRTITYSDGIVDTTEVKAFDVISGIPVINKLYNEHNRMVNNEDKTITNFTQLAYTKYPSMGTRNNENVKLLSDYFLFDFSDHFHYDFYDFTNVAQSTKKLKVQVAPGLYYVNSIINRGDRLKIKFGNGHEYYGDVLMKIAEGEYILQPILGNYSGTPPATLSSGISSIEVLFSGRTNQLNSTCGNIIGIGDDNVLVTRTASGIIFNNVLSYSTTIFSDFKDLYYGDEYISYANNGVDFYNSTDKYSIHGRGILGRWKPITSYIYRNDNITHSTFNYSDGICNNVPQFNFVDVKSNYTLTTASGFQRGDSVSKYSLNGDILEIVNPLNIVTSKRKHLNNSISWVSENDLANVFVNTTSINASNAILGTVNFNDYESEDYYTNELISNQLNIYGTGQIPHTGKQSLLWKYNSQTNTKFNLGVGVLPQNTSHIISKYFTRFWYRLINPDNELNNFEFFPSNSEYEGKVPLPNVYYAVKPIIDLHKPEDVSSLPSDEGGGNNNTTFYSLHCDSVSRSGDWILCECKGFNDESYIPGYELQLYAEAPNTNEYFTSQNRNQFYYCIDDIVLQPHQAETQKTVVDVVSGGSINSFDRNHFSSGIQQDQKGAPIRNLAETDRGIKILFENTSNNSNKIFRTQPNTSDNNLGSGTGNNNVLNNNSLPNGLNRLNTLPIVGTKGVQYKEDLLNINVSTDNITTTNIVDKTKGSIKKPDANLRMTENEYYKLLRDSLVNAKAKLMSMYSKSEREINSVLDSLPTSTIKKIDMELKQYVKNYDNSIEECDRYLQSNDLNPEQKKEVQAYIDTIKASESKANKAKELSKLLQKKLVR